MIALGGPTLKLTATHFPLSSFAVSMIALGGPTLKLAPLENGKAAAAVSMIALGGPTLKRTIDRDIALITPSLNDSTGRA